MSRRFDCQVCGSSATREDCEPVAFAGEIFHVCHSCSLDEQEAHELQEPEEAQGCEYEFC